MAAVVTLLFLSLLLFNLVLLRDVWLAVGEQRFEGQVELFAAHLRCLRIPETAEPR